MQFIYQNQRVYLSSLLMAFVFFTGQSIASPANDIRVDGISIEEFSSSTYAYEIMATGSSLNIAADALRRRHVVTIYDDNAGTDSGATTATQSYSVNGRVGDSITVTIARPNGNGPSDYVLTIIRATPSDGSDSEDTLYNAILTNRSGDCRDYVGTYDATGMDYIYGAIRSGNYTAGTILPQQHSFSAVTINVAQDKCSITSNMVPNHDFGDTTWRTEAIVDAQMTVSFNRNPANPSSTDSGVPGALIDTPFGGGDYNFNGVILNGVPISMDSGFCYQGENQGVALGCTESNSAHQWWELVPTQYNAILDDQLAHLFQGKYHYHAIKTPLQARDSNGFPIATANGSPVIGFAPDGYPIYGHYFFDGSTVRKAISGYTLIPLVNGLRRTLGTSESPDPEDYPLGQFEQDFEFTDAGDLDACNGMMVNGQYGYYVTEDYPYTPPCTWGARDPSMDGVTPTLNVYDNSID